jgi:hypothetical protein
MKIRQDQIAAFGIAAQEDSERKLLRGLTEQFPRCESIYGEAALAAMVRLGIERAKEHRLEAEADIQRYLWLMLLFGSHWERDPQIPWAAAALAPTESMTPSDQIGRLWEQAQAWRQRVMGVDDTLHLAAIRNIQGKSVEDLCKNPSRSQRDLLVQLASMFPSKFTEVGAQPLYELTRHAVEACKPFDMMDRWAVVLVAELMFLLGAGFVADPLHPWASESLKGQSVDSVDQKLERLLAAVQCGGSTLVVTDAADTG